MAGEPAKKTATTVAHAPQAKTKIIHAINPTFPRSTRR
jgi:hypothetical protein